MFTPKLIFLQEIWVPYSEEHSINNKFINYSAQISTPDQFTHPEDRLSNPDHTWHGAAILWHDSLNSNVQNISNTHERFSGIHLKCQGQHILAISLYLPTSGKDEEFLDCLAELSIFIQDNNSDIGTILIGTDSNCSEKSCARRVQALQQFCSKSPIQDQLFTTIMAHPPQILTVF